MNLGAIYEPKGRALEYSELACNLYRGCSHGCIYCFGPAVLKIPRKEFNRPRPRSGIMKTLRKNAEKIAGDPRRVLMSFTTDPYQPLDDELHLSRDAIEILHEYRLAVTILTKGGKRAIKDFDLLGKSDEVATTLTTRSLPEQQHWEPGAASTMDRIAMLEAAKGLGLRTWVSLEPVINPEETLALIRATHQFVDLFKVGTLNYHKKKAEIDFGDFGRRAEALLKRLGCDYYLKEDLRKAMKEGDSDALQD